MRINEADVAELVDARDLKSLVGTCYRIDLSSEIMIFAKHFEAIEPMKPATKPADLQNNSDAKAPAGLTSLSRPPAA